MTEEFRRELINSTKKNSSCLEHSAKGTTWSKKNHKWVRREKSKNGKWVYYYKERPVLDNDKNEYQYYYQAEGNYNYNNISDIANGHYANKVGLANLDANEGANSTDLAVKYVRDMYKTEINKTSALGKTFHNMISINSRNYELGKEATISAARKQNKTLVSQLKSTYYGLINKAKKALGISTIRNKTTTIHNSDGTTTTTKSSGIFGERTVTTSKVK